MATTCFSIGSGGSGGVFGPSIVIGGALGAAVGILAVKVTALLGIDLQIQPSSFALVGMAGFFAAAANTPISTIIMVSEMTGNYHLLVPAMWVCILAYLIIRKQKLYDHQLKNRFHAPVHRGEMLDGVLRNLRIADVLRERPAIETIAVPATASLPELLERFANSRHVCFPVTNEQGIVVGMIRGRDLRALINEHQSMSALIIAADLAEPPITVNQHQSLLTAIKSMHSAQLEELIIVESSKSNQLVAVLDHQDIVRAYDKELVQRIDTPF